MASLGPLRRLELALAAFGLTAALSPLLVALDAIRFHTAAVADAVTELQLGAVDPAGVGVLILLVVDAGIILAAARSIAVQTHRQRRFLRRLVTVGAEVVDGHPVLVVRDSRPLAFCGGFLSPRIFVSEATLELLTRTELRAVVAHEAHHAARRDPLRLLFAGALAAAFSAVPALRSLRRREAALADLAADAAAVRALGDPAPLASALLAFDAASSPAGGVLAARVDHLIGDARPSDVPRRELLASAVALVILLLLVPRIALGTDHPELAAAAPLCTTLAIGSLVALTGSAWLASRHVTRALEPMS